MAAIGEGTSTPELTPLDSKFTAITGDASVCGIMSEKEGDTHLTDTKEEQG